MSLLPHGRMPTVRPYVINLVVNSDALSDSEGGPHDALDNIGG